MSRVVTPLTSESELQQIAAEIAEKYYTQLDKDRETALNRSLRFGYSHSPKKLKPAQQVDMFQPKPESGRLF